MNLKNLYSFSNQRMKIALHECSPHYLKMAEGAQSRVQDSINDLMTDLDKSVLRKMQGDMHRCAASCCDKTTGSMDDIHRCIEKCSTKMQGSQEYLQKELSDFQNRLQRCVMKCQDDVKDQITSQTSENVMNRYKDEFETCAVKCADNHISILSTMKKRMIDNLKSLN